MEHTTEIAPATPTTGIGTLEPDARARVESAVGNALAENTRRAYQTQWNLWTEWARSREIEPAAAEPAQVAAYLTERAETRKTATIRQAAAAISAGHRAAGTTDPTASALVKKALRGIARPARGAAGRRTAPGRTAGARRRNPPHGHCRPPAAQGQGKEFEDTAARRARTDRAIIALLFCAGMRRSEVAELRWADVGRTSKPGQLRVRIRTSKSNPISEHDDYRLLVNGFAAALVDLKVNAYPPATNTERVVPLSPHQINRRIQALARIAGLEGVSAHSGRRGMASELVRRGASTTAIQAAGGWKDPQMVARYASAVNVEDGAIARYF